MYSGHRATLSDKILDEISLDGLEGITLDSLWLHLADSMDYKDVLPAELKDQIWEFIKRNAKRLQFYELPNERQTMPLYKRFETLNEDFGIPVAKTVNPMRRYKLTPIQEKGIVGSCECYKERIEIAMDELKEMSLNDVTARWGNKFVIVASQELRYEALIPPSSLIPKDLPVLHYCILEIIGRSRYNGEVTSGASSLQDYCKDSTLIFYTKSKLLNLRVITAQQFNEFRNNRIMLTTLLRLPRFYTAYQSALNVMIETVFQALHAHPDHCVPLTKLRTMFPTADNTKKFKKIIQTHQFRRVFDVKSVLVPTQRKSANSSTLDTNDSKGRNTVMVSLRDPNMTLSELFKEKGDEENAQENVEVDKAGVSKYAYVDMVLKDQVYRAIFRHGARGVSQTELSIGLGVNCVTIRQLLKNLVKQHLVKIYLRDAGRQRIQMHVAGEYAKFVTNYNESMAEIKKLKCNTELKIPPTLKEKILDIPDITAKVKPLRYNVKQFRELSNRQIARTSIVIKAVNNKCLCHVHELLSAIITTEKAQGYKDLACRKSVRRILNSLCDDRTILMYEAILKYEKRGDTRLHRFVTHPKIDIDHVILQNEILHLKNSFFMRMEEIRLRKEAHRQAAEQKLKRKTVVNAQDRTKIEVAQKLPKFLISRYMHEFLFYIVVELGEYQKPQDITEELVQHWKKSEPSLSTKEYLDLLQEQDLNIKAYTTDISWRTFIPPLARYPEKPAGWVYLIDAIERMPLSIFMKIFRLENNIHESLESYVSHPVRQHYLLRQLPVELHSLINRIYMQKVFLTVLKLLNHMGLVQVSTQVNKDKLMMWAFLNRNALIVDTTTTEASYARINPDREYEKTRYEFGNFDDVHRYWMNMQRVCVYTKLGFRKKVEGKKERLKELTFLEYLNFDEAPFKDVGYIPGDGLGAGGLSTQLFAHTFRNWSWALHSNTKPAAVPWRPTRRVPHFMEAKNKALKVTRSVGRKKHLLPVSLVKRFIPTGNTASTSTAGTKRAKQNPRDAIDQEALKNMRTLRVTWTPEEDKLLKVARAVYTFISLPVYSLQLVTVAKICRDVIRHTLGIRHKTIQACLRRYQFLIKNNRHLPETQLWMNMLQTNEQMKEKYGVNFFTNLKHVYPNRSEFCEAIVIHFIDVMCYLFKVVHNIEATVGPTFSIPDSVCDFERIYLTRTHSKNGQKYSNHENPKTEFAVKVSVVYGLLHSSMCCSRDKVQYTLQAFEIFKHFSEDILNCAFSKARSDGLAVVLKRKYMHMELAPFHLAGPSYLLSSKYRWRLTMLKIPYHIFEAIHSSLEKILEALYGATTSQSQSYELKSPHVGQFLLIGEGIANQFWSTEVKLPSNMLAVDSEQPICGTDRILHHYHGILDNAPQIEYIKNFPLENIENRVRVKFHPANLSYKIYYSPYDQISKLYTWHLHFFCALDHLQQYIDLNLNKLQRQDEDPVLECPFNCILKSGNYLDAIARIVHERKSAIDELNEMPTQKLLHQASNGCSIKVQPNNLLAIVQLYETAWREREELADRKDLGKKLLDPKDRKFMNWKKVCQDLLEFNGEEDDIDKCDEYEPTLNKEDRIRDAFAINLPTIKISPLNLKTTDKILEYNNLSIPKSLLPVELQRELILEKIKRDSLWTYTDETIDTLRPKMSDFSSMEQKHIEEIHDFIASQKFGVSVFDLLGEFPYKTFLNRALKFLAENFIIKRVGVAFHIYVHKLHLREWVVHTFHITRRDEENFNASRKRKLENEEPSTSASARKRLKAQDDAHQDTTAETDNRSQRMKSQLEELELPKERNIIVLRPRPWIRLNGSLNRRVLDKWIGSILTECIARYGGSVTELCHHFQNMFPADIHFLLEILCDLKCVCLKEMPKAEIDIFSACDSHEETIVDEIVNPDCTYIIVTADALMRMTNFIGNRKYNVDFI